MSCCRSLSWRLLTAVVLFGCGGEDDKADDPVDTTDTTVVDDTTDTVGDDTDTQVGDDTDDSDDAVVVPDYDPDSALGRALEARCTKGVSCGETYTCAGSAWDSVDSCIATIFDDYQARSEAELNSIESFLNDVTCGSLFEGLNGFCNNEAYVDECACPANPCTLLVPSDADVVVDVTVPHHVFSRIASPFGGAHDYGLSMYMPELAENQKVAVRLGFTSPLVRDPGGTGQLVADGLFRLDQTSGGGPAHPYDFSNPVLEMGPGGSTFTTVDSDTSMVSTTLTSGSLDCALFTFTATNVAGGAWPNPLLGVVWRSTLATGSEPPGFLVDGDFTRP